MLWGNPSGGERFILAFFQLLQGAPPAKRESPAPGVLAQCSLHQAGTARAQSRQSVDKPVQQSGQPLGSDAAITPVDFLMSRCSIIFPHAAVPPPAAPGPGP